MAALIGAALLTAGCTGGREAAPAASSAEAPGLFGTDANLAPSRPDVVLRYAAHARGIAELRLPKGAGPFPLAVIFHGGCWKTGIADQAYMAPLATRWQQLGIATLNVDYREVGDGGGWPGSFEDWQAAAGLIAQAAREHPLDLSHVTLVGHSAGATAALWLAMDQDAQGPVGRRAAATVSGIIVLDGAADLEQEAPAFDGLCKFGAVEPFMGGAASDVAPRYRAISPRIHEPQARAIHIVQAVLPAPSAEVLEAMRKDGAEVTVSENKGASHFAIITPGSPVYEANEPVMLKILRL
jgi:acetyl esterase/lipase